MNEVPEFGDPVERFFEETTEVRSEKRTSEVALLFNDLNKIEAVTEIVLQRIPCMQDEQIVETCQYAKEIGRQAWRIECACHAALVARSEKRGEKSAFIAEAAKSLGVSDSTIYRNAQTHDLAETAVGLETQTILPEKSFYEQALRAPEPEAALELMARKREADPRYSTTQAERDVKALRQGTPVEAAETLFWPSVGLDSAHRSALNALCMEWGVDQPTAMKRALMEAYLTLREGEE